VPISAGGAARDTLERSGGTRSAGCIWIAWMHIQTALLVYASLRARQNTVDWLNSNFFKTELELGHCLRLPQEGLCECDLYLNCAKFVTTRSMLRVCVPGVSASWSLLLTRNRTTGRVKSSAIVVA
jgi:hypothetical protein